MPEKRRDTIARENLTIVNNSIPENPELAIWVNPLGFGVGPSDIVYDLALGPDNRIVTSSRREIPADSGDMTNDDGITVIFCKTTKLGINSCAFIFSFNEGGRNFESIFKQILSGFCADKSFGNCWRTKAEQSNNGFTAYAVELF